MNIVVQSAKDLVGPLPAAGAAKDPVYYSHSDHNLQADARKVAGKIPGAIVKYSPKLQAWHVLTVADAALARKRPYQPVSADQLSRSTFSRSLVQHVLPHAELVVMNGSPGAGKTTLALAMAVALVNGEQCFGKKTQTADVVYWIGEGRTSVDNCMKAYQSQGYTPADLPRFVTEAFNARNADQVKAFAAAVGKCDALWIDTLSAALPGGAQNSTEDMSTFVAACQYLHRHTGAVIIACHHPTKADETNLRGSGVLLGAADTVIQVSRQGDYRSASITKQKSGLEGSWCNFKLVPYVIGRDDWGDPQTAVIAEPVGVVEAARKPPKGPTERALWDYAQAHERFTEDGIVDAVTQIRRKEKPKTQARNIRREFKRFAGKHFMKYGDEFGLPAPLVQTKDWLT